LSRHFERTRKWTEIFRVRCSNEVIVFQANATQIGTINAGFNGDDLAFLNRVLDARPKILSFLLSAVNAPRH